MDLVLVGMLILLIILDSSLAFLTFGLVKPKRARSEIAKIAPSVFATVRGDAACNKFHLALLKE